MILGTNVLTSRIVRANRQMRELNANERRLLKTEEEFSPRLERNALKALEEADSLQHRAKLESQGRFLVPSSEKVA